MDNQTTSERNAQDMKRNEQLKRWIGSAAATALLAASLTGLTACGSVAPSSPATTRPATARPTTADAEEEPESQAQAAESEPVAPASVSYAIVDTAQNTCFDASAPIACPAEGAAFTGQDAQVAGNAPSYTDNGDGTISDAVTGLMWQQSPDIEGDDDIDVYDKITYANAGAYCQTLDLAGYDDWRLPDIKTLYSLMDFRGTDPNPTAGDDSGLTPFIDATVFDVSYGDVANGERIIDAQLASSTAYVDTVFNGQAAMFGLNLADGRIKGYPQDKTFYVLCVRGNESYGQNDLVDNGDGTVSDNATGLMWAQEDNGAGVTWEDALAYAEAMNAASYLGYDDWRLPNAKELQSIVDYTRSPGTTGSAAIDPLFSTTPITNEAGDPDFGFAWTSTTHQRVDGSGASAVYIAFGRGLGSMDGSTVIDVHGAGCQRSDPKDGDPAETPSWGNGPQGDLQRVFNYVRLVRGGAAAAATDTAQPQADSASSAPIQDEPVAGERSQAQRAGQTPRRPPQEAIEACAGLAQGTPCTVETPQGEISGGCRTIPSEETLACVPAPGDRR